MSAADETPGNDSAGVRGRILVADDQLLTREALAEVLREEGYEVVLASNGAEALDAFRHSRFDLLLTDLDMPLVDGLHVLEQVQKERAGLPVVVLTANVTSAAEGRAARLGARAYINKPIDLDALLAEVERCLALSRRHCLSGRAAT